LGIGRAYRSKLEKAIAIDQKQRSRHVFVIGATRSGKSKAIESWIRQDINNHNGIGVIDPHGDLIDDILAYIASLDKFDYSRLVYFDPTSTTHSIGFNPLQVISGAKPYGQVLELVGAFKKIWADSWGARMEEILRNTLMTLAVNGLTLLEASRLLTDQCFRDFLVSQSIPEDVRDYWTYRFNPLPDREKATWIESTLNKVNALCADPYIRTIIGQTQSTFNIREIMDRGKILLINLSKGRLKDNAFLLGALLLATIQVSTLSRVDMPKSERTPWYLFIDEFQTFATESFSEILSESAKYGLSLTLANQNLDQLKKETPYLKGAILGNAGVHVYFRVSREDAEVLAKEMFTVTGKVVKEDQSDLFNFGGKRLTYYTAQEEFEYYCNELTSQDQREAYVKIQGHKDPYLLKALEVIPASVKSQRINLLITKSLEFYARPRDEAEQAIKNRREGIDNIIKPAAAHSTSSKQKKHKTKERENNGRQPVNEEEFF